MVQTTVDISHLNVAPTVLEVAAKTQETAKNLQQKTPVTPAVESIISLSLVPQSKNEMIVKSTVYNKYIIATHHLKRLIA